jgi:Uncharacterized protein conserved in bacteria
MKKERDSNIELLRIVAMLMILILHAIGAMGPVSAAERVLSPTTSFLRVFGEQACIIGVNLFILISGWFGIHASAKGLLSLLFQIAFYTVCIPLVFRLSGFELTGGIKDILVACTGMSYWFIPSYLVLYVLSPALNAFTESAPRKAFTLLLLTYFTVQFVYGRFGDQAHFQAGYSTLSFIGLYLLARFCRKYPSRWTALSVITNLAIWLGITLTVSLFNHFTGEGTPLGGPHSTFDYNHPAVVAASLFFFLAFTRMSFRSRAVNWLATGAFAIYVIHMNYLVAPYYRDAMVRLYESFGIWFFLILLPVVLSVGLACILADKVRIPVWGWLWGLLDKTRLGKRISDVSA